MRFGLFVSGCVCLMSVSSVAAQTVDPALVDPELRENYAQTAGMAIAAAQACPNLALNGSQLEILGAPLGVTIDNLIDDLVDPFRGGFELFQSTYEDMGAEAACESVSTALGAESELKILDEA